MKKILSLAAVTIAVSFAASPAFATPEKAKQTGMECSQCHQKQANDQNPGQRGQRNSADQSGQSISGNGK